MSESVPHLEEYFAVGDELATFAGTADLIEKIGHWLENEATRAQITERIPLGRVAEPRDVVGTVLFLCSPASDFVTGQVLYVDGGITASQ